MTNRENWFLVGAVIFIVGGLIYGVAFKDDKRREAFHRLCKPTNLYMMDSAAIPRRLYDCRGIDPKRALMHE